MKLTSKTLFFLSGSLLLIIIGAVGLRCFNSDSRYSLERAKEGTPAYTLKLLFDPDTKNIEKLITGRGFTFPPSEEWKKNTYTVPSHDFVYGKPIMSDRVCDIPAVAFNVEGEDRRVYRLINEDGWKFHDVYFETSNGRSIGVWGSEYQKNRFLAISKSFWKDIKNSAGFWKPLLDITAAIAN